MVTALFIDFSDAQEQLALESVMESCKFNLIRAFMVGVAICKNEQDSFKIKSTRVVTTFLPL